MYGPYGCMDVWVYGCMGVCVWVHGCTDVLMDVTMYECMNVWTSMDLCMCLDRRFDFPYTHALASACICRAFEIT